MMKMKIIKKRKKVNQKKKVKINFRMMRKNLILTLLKMIIRISKELEKYVNMIKRLKKIVEEKVISKNKDIK